MTISATGALSSRKAASDGDLAVTLAADCDIVIDWTCGYTGGGADAALCDDLSWDNGGTNDFTLIERGNYTGGGPGTQIEAQYMVSTDPDYPGSGAQTLRIEGPAYDEGFVSSVLQFTGVDISGDPIVDTDAVDNSGSTNNFNCSLAGLGAGDLAIIAINNYNQNLSTDDLDGSANDQTVLSNQTNSNNCTLGIASKAGDGTLQAAGDAGSVTGVAFALLESTGTDTTLAASISGDGAASGNLTTVIQLGASLTGNGSSAAEVTTSIDLDSSASGLASIFGSIDTNIQFSSSISGNATALGGLLTQPLLFSSVSGLSISAGNLTAQIQMQANVNGDADAQGNLTTDILLAGNIGGSTSVSASLSTGDSLNASISAGASVEAALTTNILLAGSISGGASVSASLEAASQLETSVSGLSAVSGDLTASILLSTNISGPATAQGALTVGVLLAGNITASASASGELETGSSELAGVISGSSVIGQASLTTGIYFGCSLLGEGEITGALEELDSFPNIFGPSIIQSNSRVFSITSKPKTFSIH